MRGLIVDLFAGGGMITCPHGQGETDRARCVDRAMAAPEGTGCLLCPVPPVLIALGGEDEINQQLASRLSGLLSCPWTPPVLTPPPLLSSPRLKPGPKPTPGRIMALAIYKALSFGSRRELPKTGLSRLLTIYNKIPGVTPLPDSAALYRALRRFGLPVTRSASRSYSLEANAHVRAFVRSYKIQEAA